MVLRRARQRALPVLVLPILLLTLACDDPAEPGGITDPHLARAVTAGGAHTCAITGDGTLYCWGWGDWGQLGDGAWETRLEPVGVALPAVAQSVSAGQGHTCAIVEGGDGYCWGGSGYGALGDGTTEDRASPTRVAGGLTFAAIEAGGTHSCGLTEGGVAYCWGWNDHGQLGDGTTEARTAPVPVSTSARFRQISAGDAGHTCGVTLDGAVLCWGLNDGGQIGDGTTGEDRLEPTPVAGGARYESVEAGVMFTCGLTEAGVAHCWGISGSGQLGDGTLDDRPLPGPVSGSLTFRSLTARSHACGLTEEGRAYCWGANSSGQLGIGTLEARSEPTPAATSERFTGVSAGNRHTCAVTPAGALFCWGANGNGQLGDGGLSLGWLLPVAVWRW